MTIIEGDSISVAIGSRELVRRYFLLDTAACYGVDAAGDKARLRGSLAIPGYGPFYGMKIDELIKRSLAVAPSLQLDWSRPEVPLEDIRWLCEMGYAMSS